MGRSAAGGGAVQVELVSLGVRGDVRTGQLVTGATFTVDAGSLTAIIGRSGAGKSTLLACLAGEDQPVTGRVRVAGEDVWPAPRRRRSHGNSPRVGRMFQSGNLIMSLSVLQNVALPDRLRHERDWRARAHRALGIVGLTDSASRRPASLSVGEQQRVAVARLIASRPEVALVDEPTSSLDEVTAECVSEALVRLARSGTALVVATHDLRLAARADQTLAIANTMLREHDSADPAALRVVLERDRC